MSALVAKSCAAWLVALVVSPFMAPFQTVPVSTAPSRIAVAILTPGAAAARTFGDESDAIIARRLQQLRLLHAQLQTLVPIGAFCIMPVDRESRNGLPLRPPQSTVIRV